MTPYKTLDLKQAIVYMKQVGEDSLALADKAHQFRLIDNQNYENIFALKLENAKTDPSNHNIDFSSDSKYFAFSEQDKPLIRIVDIAQKKVLCSLSKHTQEIESLCFSPNGKYLASGGIDGKIFLWNVQKGSFISRFPSHPDYVAFLRFSPDGNYLISCGFEGAMICTNIHTKAKEKKYKPHKSRVTALGFVSNHIILTGSKEGEVLVMNYLSGEVLARFMTPHGEVKTLSCDGKVIYVSGMQHAVAIYSLEDYKAIKTHYIAAPGVPSYLSFNAEKSHLIVGCLNGKLAYYNLENEHILHEAIKMKAYKQAYELIEENPLLNFCASKELFDKTWEKTYDVAFLLLVKKETKKATALLESFQGVPKISSQIQNLLRDFKSYERFSQLVTTKKFSAAYSLVEQAPTLGKTPLFLKVESLWQKTFQKAMILMLTKNDAGTAKLILQDFNNIPSKVALIQTLINDPDVFKHLIQGLKEKDFKKLLTLIAQHSYLKETSEYQKAMKLAENVFEEAKHKLAEKDFDTVLEYATLILNVPHLHDKAEVLNNYASKAKMFLLAYESDSFELAYSLLDENPFLIELSEAKEMEEKWQSMLDTCEVLASKGNIKGIKETLGEFFVLKSRANRVGALLKIAYIIQIKKYASSPKLSNADIIRALNTYIVLLSYDPEIEVIIQKLRKLRQLELQLGEDEMEVKADNVWLKHSNGNIPDIIFKT